MEAEAVEAAKISTASTSLIVQTWSNLTLFPRRIPGLTFESKDVAIPLKRLQEKTLDVEPIKKLMAPYLQQFKDRGRSRLSNRNYMYMSTLNRQQQLGWVPVLQEG